MKGTQGGVYALGSPLEALQAMKSLFSEAHEPEMYLQPCQNQLYVTHVACFRRIKYHARCRHERAQEFKCVCTAPICKKWPCPPSNSLLNTQLAVISTSRNVPSLWPDAPSSAQMQVRRSILSINASNLYPHDLPPPVYVQPTAAAEHDADILHSYIIRPRSCHAYLLDA